MSEKIREILQIQAYDYNPAIFEKFEKKIVFGLSKLEIFFSLLWQKQ